jgi:hypothetical protein
MFKNLTRIGTVICSLFLLANSAFSQGTSITYQGTLTDAGKTANGLYDLRFSLYDSISGGVQIGGTVIQNLAVTNGVFSTEIDFGSNFAGASRWMQLDVRTNGVGAFVVLNSRQKITAAPYATYALATATASNVVSGAVVSSVNSLKDDVLLQAGNNVSITPSGNTLTIAAANGGGSSIWSQLGTNAYYSAGKVGIGTNGPVHRLSIAGGPLWTANFWQGALDLGYASAIGWQGAPGGQHFGIGQSGGGLYFFHTLSSPGTTASAANYDMEITDAGNLLVGGGSELPGVKLQVNGAGSFATGGSGGTLNIGTPNGESGLSISGSARADVRFDGSTLKLLTGPAGGPPSAANGIVITMAGNVGVGSPTPVGKLEVVAQDALRLVGFQPFLTILDSNAGYARSRIQGVGGAIVLEPESYVSGANANNSVTIANTGNVSVKNITIRGGADVAEPFDFSSDQIAPGSVVIIDDENPGKLKLSKSAYDTRVAGIISGANGVNPGLSLHQEGILDGSQNVALGGRVYVLADASYGAIKPGDLLTTSKTPGHAMKVLNHDKAQGAILGKAMSALKSGKGMVLVLVTLQ